MTKDSNGTADCNTLSDVSHIGSEQSATNETNQAEYLSQRGAMELARRLQAYWHEQGSKAARFWAVPIDERFPKVGSYQLYKLDCNFVNGLPPDWPLKGKK